MSNWPSNGGPPLDDEFSDPVQTDRLMFDKEDVYTTHNKLSRLMRVIFYRRKITHDDYIHKHMEMCHRNNKQPSKIIHDRNNIRRALSVAAGLTYKTWLNVLNDILYLNVIRISVTIEDPVTGKQETYHSDDKLE